MKTVCLATKTLLLASFAALAALAAVPSSRATLAVVDQQNTVGDGTLGDQVSNGKSLGQSFTPTLPSLNAVDLVIQSSNVSDTLQLSLLQGSGFGGTVLGTSGPLVLLQNFQTTTTLEFTFATPIALVPGNIYTYQLTETAFTPYANIDFGFYPDVSFSNPYAGGQFFNPDGSTFAEADWVFAEGLTAAGVSAPGGVPEPSTWALLGLGVAGLGVVTLRRRRAVRTA